MVCHETYKDDKGNWLYPEEVVKLSEHKFVTKKNSSAVTVGPSESMSKSKKNTIDPEEMIKKYGADAVRWFILSDSPPEKDIQWSDIGVVSSNKFLQKIWNLNFSIINRKDCDNDSSTNNIFYAKIEDLIAKIDSSIKEFKFNVTIALFYETYNVFNNSLNQKINNDNLKINLTKIMKLMIPFTPHLANECLDLLKCSNRNIWPEINKNLQNNIKFAVQINGKTREIITVERDLDEKNTMILLKKNTKINKFLVNKKIIKTIFVKNKIINCIIK